MLRTNSPSINPMPHSPTLSEASQVSSGGTPTTSAELIKGALEKAATTEGATILVVGYSPTGNGHTPRLLNVIDTAIKKDTLKAGSTVVLNVPEKWEGANRHALLKETADKLRRHRVNVIVAEAEKSVLGFLEPGTGASDDPKILNRFARLPLRPQARQNSITGCKIYTGDRSVDFDDIHEHSISAKRLMESIKEIVGPHVMKTKVKVLTDMDPALQKAAAARNIGIPGHNRVSQQNHGILLDERDRSRRSINLAPKNAVLAKVLSGKGENVSHIELGEKNTLSEIPSIADDLKLNENSTKVHARQNVVEHLLAHGVEAAINPDTGKVEGIMYHREEGDEPDIRNIMYVYAHESQNRIAEYVQERLRADNPDPAYRQTLFVFCGKKPLTKHKTNKELGFLANAARVAALADGDVITTGGAGMIGEFKYLAKYGGAKAGALALPIAGHDEQQANATHISEDENTRQFVTVARNTTYLESTVNAFVRERAQAAPAKYGEDRNPAEMPTLRQLLEAVNKKGTYVDQTHDLLFPEGGERPENSVGDNLAKIEQKMRRSAVLTANRRYIKMVFQVLDKIETDLNSMYGGGAGIEGGSKRLKRQIEIRLKQKDQPMTFNSLKQFSGFFRDDEALKRALGADVTMNINDFALLEDARNLIREIAYNDASSEEYIDEVRQRINRLKHDFGRNYTTGF